MDERRRSFEQQVLPHLDTASRFARWLARPSADADDIVQDAMLRAYRGFDGLRGTDAKAWLLTILRNCHSTVLRQQRRAFTPLSEEHNSGDAQTVIDAAQNPESASIRTDEQRTLERLMANLHRPLSDRSRQATRSRSAASRTIDCSRPGINAFDAKSLTTHPSNDPGDLDVTQSFADRRRDLHRGFGRRPR
jgi:RNA polymerase sigma factor (sigma-70 family)